MSAHSVMRGTYIFACILLAAVASAAGSSQTHRKSSAHSHSATNHRSRTASSHTYSSHATASRVRSRRSTTAVYHPVRYTPESTTASTGISGATPAYAIGYKNGFEAGRAAALKELQSQSADSSLNTRPSQPVAGGTTSVVPLPSAPAVTANPQRQAPATIRPPSTSSSDAAVPEPSDADPAAGPVNSLPLPAQATPHNSAAGRQEVIHDDADAAYESATLEMPRAGMPISLRGSLESLERQNSRLESEGLERILDEDDLNSRIEHGLLSPLPVSANLTVNPSLPENRRYCRSWTAQFLSDLAKAHAAAYHRSFQVNSAVRTVEYQKHLMRTNGNAAAAEGDIVSPHLTGATIDIGKQGMTHSELMWMRRQLYALQNAGKIDVEEEFEQACFHITVYKNYESARPAHKSATPAVREASAPDKTPAPHRGSSLSTSIAAGAFVAR